MSYELFYLNQLNNLLPKDTYLPVTSWSIAPTTIALILNEILIENRKNIIEFGSGLSTVYICLLIAKYKLDVNFISVDDNLEWIEKQNLILEDLGCKNLVNFVHAPIIDLNDTNITYGAQQKWYDVKEIDPVVKDSNWDMVIVDGPQGSITPFSRYSAVPFLRKYLDSQPVIFLDDARRTDEMEIANEWSKILGIPYKYHNRLAIFKNKTIFKNELFKV